MFFIFTFGLIFHPGLFFQDRAWALPQEKIVLSGQTMGTFYHITLMSGKAENTSLLKLKIDKRLDMVNQSMSTYLKSSEISRFNRASMNEPVKISGDFVRVMGEAEKLYTITMGAWDGTVKPLVDLWGFGKQKAPKIIPSTALIEKKQRLMGFRKISRSGHNLVKTASGITLDLASIAKGFGVDAVSELLTDMGFKNHLVEIGGEIMARGVKGKNHPWAVGISRPKKGFSDHSLYKVVTLRDKALATSGDYRNFITIQGRSYSHIINPSTGHPLDNRVVSASVIASHCTFADGLATALMVMGPQKGVELVNTLPGTECLIVTRKKDRTLIDFSSRGFESFCRAPEAD